MQIINIYTKKQASLLVGNTTTTSKMPCKSYSLPTENCITGSKMAKIKGSICNNCYANKGNYHRFKSNILPTQKKRLHSIDHPKWVDSMIALIGKDSLFRWHDSGDIQSLNHLSKICEIAVKMPNTKFWIPTREYKIISDYAKSNIIPSNLIVRLSAMFIDKAVKIPKSLQGLKNITVSNVHTNKPIGVECESYKQGGKCLSCTKCWDINIPTISYKNH